ncbi:MAG: acetyl-CoA carboxylase biotin carboxyl carrier protein [Mariprofundaceae bacterium]|nr:acetyl-CoA carboxylase biotin carboxyl carrier protein [Mariprofundaceae bacterium]
MNLTEIRKLIKMVESSDIAELEISEGETSVRISRQSSIMPTVVTPQMMATSPVVTAPTAVASDIAVSPSETAKPDDTHLVKSPMVGTYYSASSPDVEPFIIEGQTVKKGETLCIIEAMKLMNEIEAEYNGVVEKILVDNATPLEFGQAMFVIKPA